MQKINKACYLIAIIACVVVLYFIIRTIIKAGFTGADPVKLKDAQKLNEMGKVFKENKDTFNKVRKVYSNLDVSEYYDIRNTFKNCTGDCTEAIYHNLS